MHLRVALRKFDNNMLVEVRVISDGECDIENEAVYPPTDLEAKRERTRRRQH